nr:Chain B, Formin [synthetic construct]
APPTPPPLPP